LYKLIEFKNIKKNNYNNYVGNKLSESEPIWCSEYKTNKLNIEKFNNYKGYELDYYELNKNKFLNLKSKFYNVHYKKKEAILNKNLINSIGERMMSISSNKMSNNLTKPHYFFTTGYYEKNLPSQIKHWRSSVYNFLKSEGAGNNSKDIYTSKFLSLFFSVSGLRIKSIWDTEMMVGLKIIVGNYIFPQIRNMIEYTSDRTRLGVRKLSSLPKEILTMKWVLKQWQVADKLNEIYEINKEKFSTGEGAKKRESIKDPMLGFYISKPLFKHTSFNLIIDLFVYNNKSYITNQLNNMSMRRSLYKYMYSMYIDSYAKIKDTINRPRFFYINLIEPSIHSYYDLILKYYGELIIIKNKPMMLFIYIYLLQVNFMNKLKLTLINNNLYSIFNNYFHDDQIEYIKNNNNMNSAASQRDADELNKNQIVVFKRRNIDNSYNKLNGYKSLLYKKNKELLPLNSGNIKDYNSDNTIYKQKKNLNKYSKSNFIKYNKYFADLEKKSKSSVDISTLSLWHSKGLGKTYRTPFDKKKKSYNNYTYKNKSSFTITSYKNRNKKWDFNNENKSIKKNADLWNKRNNKLIPNRDSYVFNNNVNKVNKINDSLILNNNIIINNSNDQFNINLISNETIDNNNKSYKDKEYFNKVVLGREEYINNIDKEIKNGTLLNNVFTSFYITKKSLKLNKLNKNISFINKDENINGINEDMNKIKKLQLLKDKNNNSISTNNFSCEQVKDCAISSKNLWDNLDHSIIGELSKYIYINRDMFYKSNIFQINSLLNEIKKFKGFGNIWYLLYFINVIKKEFDIVKRDILVSKNIDVRPELFNKKENISVPASFSETGNTFNNIFESKVVYYKNNVYNMKIHVWPSFLPNKREENLNFKLGYNEKIFKPYYRYMIPVFILNSFFSFAYISGYLNPLNIISSYLTVKLNNFKQNTFSLINFLTVKILLDLLHYNYRSWIRVKNKYYYLSKISFFHNKFCMLIINNWRRSHKILNKLKKTPTSFWSKYYKGVAYLAGRVVQYAELDTKRKIFVPFVIYIEDVLFSIYGKWVIIRLWPLKKYYLSSFILANRIIKLIIARRKKQYTRFNLKKMSLKLMVNLKYLQIQKGYNFYIKNYSPWPRDLFSKLNSGIIAHSLNYKSLEFFDKKNDIKHNLNTYSLLFNNLSDFLPIFNYKYTSANKDFISFMNKIHLKRKNKSPRFYTKEEYIYYWLLPLRRYFVNLTRTTDIIGLRLKVSGRPSWKRNNDRKIVKTIDYGNRTITHHYHSKLYKFIPLAVPNLRGYLKSQTQYSSTWDKSKNGVVSIKIWITSMVAADILELLLHLVRIKDLYSQLLHRYFGKKTYIFKKNKKYRSRPSRTGMKY